MASGLCQWVSDETPEIHFVAHFNMVPLCPHSTLKGTVHVRSVITRKYILAKTLLVNEQRRAVDSVKRCERRLPLK